MPDIAGCNGMYHVALDFKKKTWEILQDVDDLPMWSCSIAVFNMRSGIEGNKK